MKDIERYLEHVETFSLIYYQTGNDKHYEKMDNAKMAILKRFEELSLDIKSLQEQNKGLILALGRSDAQLIQIKEILRREGNI